MTYLNNKYARYLKHHARHLSIEDVLEVFIGIGLYMTSLYWLHDWNLAKYGILTFFHTINVVVTFVQEPAIRRFFGILVFIIDSSALVTQYMLYYRVLDESYQLDTISTNDKLEWCKIGALLTLWFCSLYRLARSDSYELFDDMTDRARETERILSEKHIRRNEDTLRALETALRVSRQQQQPQPMYPPGQSMYGYRPEGYTQRPT